MNHCLPARALDQGCTHTQRTRIHSKSRQSALPRGNVCAVVAHRAHHGGAASPQHRPQKYPDTRARDSATALRRHIQVLPHWSTRAAYDRGEHTVLAYARGAIGLAVLPEGFQVNTHAPQQLVPRPARSGSPKPHAAVSAAPLLHREAAAAQVGGHRGKEDTHWSHCSDGGPGRRRCRRRLRALRCAHSSCKRVCCGRRTPARGQCGVDQQCRLRGRIAVARGHTLRPHLP
jgi:hypothetical protein